MNKDEIIELAKKIQKEDLKFRRKLGHASPLPNSKLTLLITALESDKQLPETAMVEFLEWQEKNRVRPAEPNELVEKLERWYHKAYCTFEREGCNCGLVKITTALKHTKPAPAIQEIIEGLEGVKFRFIIDNGVRKDLKTTSREYSIADILDNLSGKDSILEDMDGGCRNNCANESDNSCYCEPEYLDSKVVGVTSLRNIQPCKQCLRYSEMIQETHDKVELLNDKLRNIQNTEQAEEPDFWIGDCGGGRYEVATNIEAKNIMEKVYGYKKIVPVVRLDSTPVECEKCKALERSLGIQTETIAEYNIMEGVLNDYREALTQIKNMTENLKPTPDMSKFEKTVYELITNYNEIAQAVLNKHKPSEE